MNDLKHKIQLLMEKINSIHQEIHHCIKENEFSAIDALLTKREVHIAELIDLTAIGALKDELLQCLMLLKEKNALLMMELKDKQANMKSTIFQVGKMKQYIA